MLLTNQVIRMLKRCFSWQVDITMATAVKVSRDKIRGNWGFVSSCSAAGESEMMCLTFLSVSVEAEESWKKCSSCTYTSIFYIHILITKLHTASLDCQSKAQTSVHWGKTDGTTWLCLRNTGSKIWNKLKPTRISTLTKKEEIHNIQKLHLFTNTTCSQLSVQNQRGDK